MKYMVTKEEQMRINANDFIDRMIEKYGEEAILKQNILVKQVNSVLDQMRGLGFSDSFTERYAKIIEEELRARKRPSGRDPLP